VNEPGAADRLAEEALENFRRDQLDAALDGFRAAEALYAEDGQPVRRAEMANNIAVTLIQLNRPQEALAALSGTAELFAEAGEQRLQAQAIGNEASVYEALDVPAKAIALYQRSLSIFDELGDSDARSYTLQALSRMQLKSGQAFQALDSMQAALDARPKRGLIGRMVQNLLRFPSRWLNR
jgi:tetratricopeptide (TPR) repeat protein